MLHILEDIRSTTMFTNRGILLGMVIFDFFSSFPAFLAGATEHKHLWSFDILNQSNIIIIIITEFPKECHDLTHSYHILSCSVCSQTIFSVVEN